jgi:hypothetical protein
MPAKPQFTTFIASLYLALASSAQATDLIPLGSSWKYRVGTQLASNPADAWRSNAFNDVSWSSGAAPIGYDTIVQTGTSIEVNWPSNAFPWRLESKPTLDAFTSWAAVTNPPAFSNGFWFVPLPIKTNLFFRLKL